MKEPNALQAVELSRKEVDQIMALAAKIKRAAEKLNLAMRNYVSSVHPYRHRR